MKKIILVVLSLLVLSLSTINVYGENINYEFFPLGINYLDSENMTFFNGDTFNDGIIKTIKPFRIKPDDLYSLYFMGYSNGYLHEVKAVAMNKEKDKHYLLECNPSLLNILNMNTTEDSYYLSLEFKVHVSDFTETNIRDLGLYVFCENNVSNIDELSYDELQYAGPNYENYEIKDEIELTTKASKPLDLSNFTNMIKVVDEIDGDITKNLKQKPNDYVYNMGIVGTYLVTYTVTNSKGKTSELNLHISVEDDIPPVITGNDTYYTSTLSLADLEMIKASVKAIDNYDGNITSKMIITHDEYSIRKSRTGEFIVSFQVEDSSGNQTNFDVNVIVEEGDLEPPVITGVFNYSFSKDEFIPETDFIQRLNAIDNVDGDITNRINIIRNDYANNYMKPGTYDIVVEVSDSAGNVNKQIIKVTVKSDSSPIFFVDMVKVFVQLNTNINSTDIIKHLKKLSYIPNDSEVEILTNDYNPNNIGEYKLSIKYDNKTENITINVIPEKKKVKTSVLKRAFQKIFNFFRKIFS